MRIPRTCRHLWSRRDAARRAARMDLYAVVQGERETADKNLAAPCPRLSRCQWTIGPGIIRKADTDALARTSSRAGRDMDGTWTCRPPPAAEQVLPPGTRHSHLGSQRYACSVPALSRPPLVPAAGAHRYFVQQLERYRNEASTNPYYLSRSHSHSRVPYFHFSRRA